MPAANAAKQGYVNTSQRASREQQLLLHRYRGKCRIFRIRGGGDFEPMRYTHSELTLETTYVRHVQLTPVWQHWQNRSVHELSPRVL